MAPKAQAALAGQSINEFLLAQLVQIARVPTVGEPAELIRERTSYRGPSTAALRKDLTAYDATYLALAEALDEPILLTGDGELADRARKSLGNDQMLRVP